MCFTETWLCGLIPDSALQLAGFRLFRADRLAELSGKKKASIAWLSTCIPSPAVTTDRRCVFLASPQNTEWIHRAGNISGSSQHCARTECCMGYFQLENRKPTPVLLSNVTPFVRFSSLFVWAHVNR
ncbi:anti-Muellerian hormone type-2 receptor isoform X1 [Tachysurus ichikawai]